MATMTMTHAAMQGVTTGADCGGVWRGDWESVTCERCGLTVNTLDVRPPAGSVLRLARGGILVAVPIDGE